jgi:cbb3-type cytochrome oxidase maturation protein
MEILILLIPMSLVLVFLAGVGYLWMQSGGQFDDLDAAASSIIADDDRIPKQLDMDQKKKPSNDAN